MILMTTTWIVGRPNASQRYLTRAVSQRFAKCVVIVIFAACSFSLTANLAGQGNIAAPAVTKVGPPRGTLIGTGGGTGPEMISEFIRASGGPDSLIIVIPTSSSFGGDVPEGKVTSKRIVAGVVEEFTEARLTAPLKSAGAKN